MKQPDDATLKAEIDAIASRIDHIIETVEQHYPSSEESCSPELDEQTTSSRPNTSKIDSYNQKPEAGGMNGVNKE